MVFPAKRQYNTEDVKKTTWRTSSGRGPQRRPDLKVPSPPWNMLEGEKLAF